MMTDTEQQLARKLADHPRFVLCPGMGVVAWAPGHGEHLKRWRWIQSPDQGGQFREWGYVPDLADAATKGVLLAMVREVWGDPTICVSHIVGVDVWDTNGPANNIDARTEGAALARAWLAGATMTCGHKNRGLLDVVAGWGHLVCTDCGATIWNDVNRENVSSDIPDVVASPVKWKPFVPKAGAR